MSYRQLHFIRRGVLSVSNYILKSTYGHAVCGVLRGVALNRGLLDYFPAFAGKMLKDAWNDGHTVALPLWIADQVRNDVCGASMRVSPPCGYCLKASMTGLAAPHPVDSCFRGNDGEGPLWICRAATHPPSRLRVKSAMTVCMMHVLLTVESN